MTKNELINFFNKLYPFKNSDEWDYCGPCEFSDSYDELVTGILVSLDVTDLTINEAMAKKCNVIISHHPIFYTPDLDTPINNVNLELKKKMSKNKILHIALHTCFDLSLDGTNFQFFQYLAKKIKVNSYHQEKYLFYIELAKPIKIRTLFWKLSSHKFVSGLRYVYFNKKRRIQKICLGLGSCSSFLNDVANKCDCFLTGDVKWHAFLDAYKLDLLLIDINHDAENVFNNKIYNDLKSISLNAEVYITKRNLKILSR